jgi:5'(3')-deoxyribonucleotidase
MRKRLLVDVDEVLADFQAAMFAALQEVSGRTLRAEDFHVWDGFSVMTPKESEAVRAICRQPGWCTALEPKPGAQTAIEKLRQVVDVYVVTSPFPAGPTWAHERDVWLKRHFDFEPEEIVYARSKFVVRGDALLEDNPHNLTRWLDENPNGLGMLWHLPNTSKLAHGGVRVRSWDEVLYLVQTACNEV